MSEFNEEEEIQEELPEEEPEGVETGEEEEPTPDADETDPEEEEKPAKKSAEAGLKAAVKAEREKRQAIERDLAEIKAQLAPKPAEVDPQEESKQIEAEVARRVGPRPTREQVAFDEEAYDIAVEEWRDRKAETKAMLREYVNRTKAEARTATETKSKFVGAVAAKGQSAYDDFRSVAYLPEGALKVFAQLDNPADVAYALGKDAAAKQKVADMLTRGEDPAVFIGQFSARVASKKPNISGKEVKAKPTSTQRPGQGGETSVDQKAARASYEQAKKSGNFAEYLERIGAY